MKRWWREWALIDLVALGVGLALLLAYLIFYPSVDQNSAVVILWPNLIAEIIGVWLSVRIIDYLLKRREQFHESRRALVGDFRVLANDLTGILPISVYSSVQREVSLLAWIQEHYPARSQYLHSDERAGADECLALAGEAVAQTVAVVAELQVVGEARTALRSQFSQANGHREEVVAFVHKLRFEVFHDAVEHPVPTAGLADELARLLAANRVNLSANEATAIGGALQSLRAGEQIEHPALNGLSASLQPIGRLSYTNFLWADQQERALEMICRNPLGREVDWRTLLKEAAEALHGDQPNLPASILEPAQTLLADTVAFGDHVIAFRHVVEQYAAAADRLRRDVAEET